LKRKNTDNKLNLTPENKIKEKKIDNDKDIEKDELNTNTNMNQTYTPLIKNISDQNNFNNNNLTTISKTFAITTNNISQVGVGNVSVNKINFK
jgi:hypothetical protein